MKKVCLLFVVIVLFTSSISFAQLQGEVAISGGIGHTFGSELKAFGYGGGIEYWVSDGLGLSGQFHRYFRDDTPYSLIDLDFRYYLIDVGVGLYGNAGYSIMNIKGITNKSGVNLGAGMLIPISCSTAIGTEIKYTLIDILTESGNQKLGLGLNASIVFRL